MLRGHYSLMTLMLVNNLRGYSTPTPMERTGCYSKVSTGPEKNCFKAIHFAPTKFSGQILQSTTWLGSKSKTPPIMVHEAPALLKVRSRLQRTSLIQKRGITTHFRYWWGPKNLCSVTFKWDSVQDHRCQRGAEEQWLLFCNSWLFLFFNTLFLIESYIGQFKKIKWSILNS